jgi:hypothetical protein
MLMNAAICTLAIPTIFLNNQKTRPLAGRSITTTASKQHR